MAQQQLEFPPPKIEQKLAWLKFISLPVAVFVLSLAAILIRLSENELGSNGTIFNRFWIAAVAFALWNSIKHRCYRLTEDLPMQQEPYTIRDIVLLLVLASLMSVGLVVWAWSLTLTSVANSNLLHNLTPFFATLGGWVFLGHRFDGRFLMGLILALGGTIVIGVEDLQVTPDNFIGDGLALLTAVLYAASLLVIEQLISKYEATTILLWYCTLGSLLTLPVVLIAEDRVFPSSMSGWLAVICLALLCQVIGQGILSYSLKRFSSGFVSLVLLLEPIITAILAWAIFFERLSLLNWLAFFVILVGIYLAKSGQGAQKATAE